MCGFFLRCNWRYKLGAKTFFAIYAITMSAITGISLFGSMHRVESLTFVSCKFDNNAFVGDYILFRVKNNGTTNVVPVALLLDLHPYRQYPNGPQGLSIPPGETMTLAIDYNWTSERYYSISVVTNTGRFFYTIEKAPQR